MNVCPVLHRQATTTMAGTVARSRGLPLPGMPTLQSKTREHGRIYGLDKPWIQPFKATARFHPRSTTSYATDQDQGSDILFPQDCEFMGVALDEAKRAATEGEVPVGAVMVHQGKVVSKTRNRSERGNDPTAHAEILCIREAAKELGSWKHLKDATMYVTLEPCPMCAGAILQSRVGTVVWGARNTLLGGDGSWISLLATGNLCDKSAKAMVVDKEQEKKGTMNDAKRSQTLVPLALQHPFHRSLNIRRHVLEEACGDVMSEFFKGRRRGHNHRTTDPSLSRFLVDRLSSVVRWLKNVMS